MNAAHWHLLLNHAPVFGTATALLLFAAARWRKSHDFFLAGLVAVILSGIMVVPVYLSGEGGERVLKRYPETFAEDLIHEHEEAALVGCYLAVGAALGAAFALFGSNRFPRGAARVGYVVIAVTVLSFGLMARAGWIGGKIRHIEIRTAFLSPAAEEKLPKGSVDLPQIGRQNI